jgi:hypothetical protein
VENCEEGYHVVEAIVTLFMRGGPGQTAPGLVSPWDLAYIGYLPQLETTMGLS